MGTANPQAAAAGARGIDILSPTPPVECLSILGLSILDKLKTLPDCVMAVTQAINSSSSRPRMATAISIAVI